RGDLGATSELGGLVRRAKGGQLFMMGSAIQSDAFFGVAGKNSIQKPEDFIGKTIGLPKGSGDHLFLAMYAKYHKRDLSKMNLKFLQAPESVAALSRGDIDALFLWEPWLSRAVAATPGSRIITRSNENNILKLNSYAFFSKRLLDNPTLGGKVLLA